MKVERILNESDLLPQKVFASSRRKKDGVFGEDAVSFEGKEQNPREAKDNELKNYSKRKTVQQVSQEEEDDTTSLKEELDVTV